MRARSSRYARCCRTSASSRRERSPAISPAPNACSERPRASRGGSSSVWSASARTPRRIYARRLWEDPLASKEQLVFALRTALDEISAALAADGLAALRLAVKLEREDDEPLRLERSVLPPTRESAALLRSLRWALEERAHIGRVIGCAVEVREAE